MALIDTQPADPKEVAPAALLTANNSADQDVQPFPGYLEPVR